MTDCGMNVVGKCEHVHGGDLGEHLYPGNPRTDGPAHLDCMLYIGSSEPKNAHWLACAIGPDVVVGMAMSYNHSDPSDVVDVAPTMPESSADGAEIVRVVRESDFVVGVVPWEEYFGNHMLLTLLTVLYGDVAADTLVETSDVTFEVGNAMTSAKHH